MSPSPSIVPSRNALQALRRLAYGGSTIIAAVGSLFTVAGASYDTQRRVRLAERLIETKRTIRSVSNSNGTAHMTRMFEAAEKGEDFSLEMTRSQKRNTRRDYSALTIENPQSRPPEGSRPSQAHPSPLEDARSDMALVEKDSSGDESLGRLQRSTRMPLQSTPSQRWKKMLPLEFPPLVRSGIAQDVGWRTIAYDDPIKKYDRAQLARELSSTSPIRAGRMLVENTTGMRDMVNIAARRSNGQRCDLAHIARHNGAPGHDPGKETHAIERILASTQQQHKLHDHRVYGRPGNELLAQQEVESVSTSKQDGRRSNSSAAERIVAATQQQHKLHSHAVYGRPGKANTEVHAHLNQHVALWLSSDGASGSNSDLKYDIGDQTGYALGGAIKPKRSVSISTRKGPHLKPLRRSFSTSVNETDPVSGGPFTGHPSLGQKNNQYSSEQPPRASEAVSDDRTTPHGLERTQALPTEKQQASSRSTPVMLDLKLNPWPISVSSDTHNLGSPFNEKDLPERPQSEVNRAQPLEASVVNDLSSHARYSNRPALRPVLRPSTPANPLPMGGDAHLGSDEFFEQCATVSETVGYAVWDEYIRALIALYGNEVTRTICLKGMSYYSAPGDPKSWDLVHVLHKNIYKRFGPSFPPYLDNDAERLLTRHILEVAPESQRAAELLFPLDGKDTELEAESVAEGVFYSTRRRGKDLFANANKYLWDLWDHGEDSKRVVSEMRKVIRIAKLQGIELAEELFFGIIQRLTSWGQIEQAQALFDEMAYYHQIEPTFLTRSVLVCGHARAGDWDRVAKEIEAMHSVHDLSRRQPLGYSLMFNRVLAEYASRRSVAQTHDFLVHALGYWGLVPTSAVSATAIQAFLVHRRFDLVREWIETVRVLFPQVDTETSRFAWHLGSVWEDLDATCVEVEEACRAFCYRRDASRINRDLREMVRLALARDLASKLHAAEVAETGGKGTDRFHAGSPWALDHYLERAQSFVSSRLTDSQTQATASQEARDLLSQVESVARLSKLFDTKGTFTDPSPITHDGASQPMRSQNRITPAHAASLQSRVPTGLMCDILPDLSRLRTLMDEYYWIRRKEGLSTSHEILKYTCQKLRKADRPFDAMGLLKVVFKGSHVQGPVGVMFDLSIMELWLRCAYETKCIPHCLTVFWAVLDAGEDYLLTSKFVLLANITYVKVRNHRLAAPSSSKGSKHETLDFLINRLRRKLWANNEDASPASDRSKGVEYHELRKLMERQLSLHWQAQ